MIDLKVVIGAGRYPEGAFEIGLRGGDEDSRVPSLVLAASIQRYWPEARIINTYCIDKPRMKRKNPTPFSLVRFMAPALCDFKGWALYCDADQIVFADVRDVQEIVKRDLGRSVYVARPGGCTGVMLMDCAQLRHWDAWDLARRIDAGAHYGHIMQGLDGMAQACIGTLGEEWNSRDTYAEGKTKLLHFTNLGSQPWKFPGKHPLEHLWAEALHHAIEDGTVSFETIDGNCKQILGRYMKARAGSAATGG